MDKLIAISAIPIMAAALSLFMGRRGVMRILLSALPWIELGLLAFVLYPVLSGAQPDLSFCSGLSADRTGALFALLSTLVVAASLSHAVIFFEHEAKDQNNNNVPLFYLSSNLFLLSMIVVCLCDNLGYLWIGIEGTTLASAPLVYHARDKHSLEATWKYLIICSVGIAFALFGTVLIFASSQHGLNSSGTLNIGELHINAKNLDYEYLRLGFVFCLLGYGTKAGIFPLHSWLPDAHSEAPAPASAMLSGGLLNCALLAIWRLSEIVLSSGHPALAKTLPLVLGVLTVVAASFFLVRQSGIKRLWAYSSIENVGLMLCAIGLGSSALFFLQALNHSLAKVALFLLSGNIVQVTGSKQIHDIRGILSTYPVWALLLAIATFAVTGSPPFGAFISEWFLLSKSAESQQWWVVLALAFGLCLTFIVVCFHVAKCIFSTPGQHHDLHSEKQQRKIAEQNHGKEIGKGHKQNHQLLGSLIPAILILLTLAVGTTSITQFIVELP